MHLLYGYITRLAGYNEAKAQTALELSQPREHGVRLNAPLEPGW